MERLPGLRASILGAISTSPEAAAETEGRKTHVFGLTPAHLVIILVIALVVIGPGKLPEVGAAIGKSIREFQKAAGQITEPTQAPQAPQPAQQMQPIQPMQPMPPAQSYYATQPVYAAPVYPQQPPQYGAPVYPALPMTADPAAPLTAQPGTIIADLPAAGPKVD
jgi:TatA/E family protein of Tat protein translocase